MCVLRVRIKFIIINTNTIDKKINQMTVYRAVYHPIKPHVASSRVTMSLLSYVNSAIPDTMVYIHVVLFSGFELRREVVRGALVG